MDSLYTDIGQKIKGWAKWIFIVEAVSAIIGGVALVMNDASIVGLVVMICGPIAAWVSSWLLYAFGELVEKTADNESHTREILEIMRATNPELTPSDAEAQTPEAPADTITAFECMHCHKEIENYPCQHCGYQIEKQYAPYWCGKCGYLGPFRDKCPGCGSTIKIFNIRGK